MVVEFGGFEAIRGINLSEILRTFAEREMKFVKIEKKSKNRRNIKKNQNSEQSRHLLNFLITHRYTK